MLAKGLYKLKKDGTPDKRSCPPRCRYCNLSQISGPLYKLPYTSGYTCGCVIPRPPKGGKING
jgi:hypothetical protein